MTGCLGPGKERSRGGFGGLVCHGGSVVYGRGLMSLGGRADRMRSVMGDG